MMDKELYMLTLLSDKSDLSQRALAKQLDVSLGTVNGMIQSFEKEGVLKTDKINAKKVNYLLTDQGTELKNTLYVQHVSRCFDTIAGIRSTFKNNISDLVEDGKKVFYIQGETDELIRLLKMCFFEISRKTQVDYVLLSETVDLQQLQDRFLEDNKDETIVIGWDSHGLMDYGPLDYRNLLD